LASSHGGVDTPGRRLRSPYRGEAVFRLPLAAGVFGTLAVNSLNMQADASSHGIGGARAAAIAPLFVSAAKGGSGLGSGFVIPGGITLDAAALTFSRAQENASALASLVLAGLPGTSMWRRWPATVAPAMPWPPRSPHSISPAWSISNP